MDEGHNARDEALVDKALHGFCEALEARLGEAATGHRTVSDAVKIKKKHQDTKAPRKPILLGPLGVLASWCFNFLSMGFAPLYPSYARTRHIPSTMIARYSAPLKRCSRA